MTNMIKVKIKELQNKVVWKRALDNLFYRFTFGDEWKVDCCNKIRLSIILTWALLHSFYIFRGWKEYDRQSALTTIAIGFQVWIISEMIIWLSLDVGSCHGCSSWFRWWIFLHLYFEWIAKYESVTRCIIFSYGNTTLTCFAVGIAVRIQHEREDVVIQS